MALFLEYSDKVKNRKYPITKPVRQHASALYNALEKIVPKNNLKGLKDLATLKKYNVKGANSDKNGEDTNIKYITTDDAIKRLQRKGYGVGDAFIQNFLKKCVDKSTSQEEVSPVEPPKPTSNEVKPPQVKTKTINGSNGTVTYTESKKGKKIYLSEQTLKKLCEYYTQLKLPFNDTSGKGYDDKLNYEHFVDWLEYYGKYGQLEDSGIKEDDIQATFVDNNITSAFKYFFHNESEDGYFIEDIEEALRNLYYTASMDEDYLRLYFVFDEEMYENPPEDVGEYIEDIGLNIEDIDDVESILTDEGIEKLREIMLSEFTDRIYENGIPYSLEINDRGLIYIEREITMPNAMSPNIPRDEKNYFEYLMGNNFNGVGECWTFIKGKGEAYCGVGYGGGTDYILLQGWVDPRSINWQETLMRNAWSMNEEHEIFINSGYLVEIDKITLNRTSNSNYGKNILPKPILIQT